MKALHRLFLILLPLGTFAQAPPSFLPPMEIPLYLSGNFGEMRSNHFHTGLDIKTQGKTGIPVQAIAEGFVSRIKVSPYGYGNALYIEHPNGYTSVYAHLKSFNEKITTYLRDAQYELQEEWVYLYPSAGQIEVDRGEQIAKSGNTGHSGGPHLHFEIRETDTEYPVNPHLLGIEIKDEVLPVIDGLMVIPIGTNAVVDGSNDRKLIGTKNNTGNCTLRQNKISIAGEVGLAIKTKDKYSGSNNSCGVFQIKLYQDGELIFEQKMDKLDFSTSRYVNAHIVYDHFKDTKSRYQRNYLLPNNELSIYSLIKNNGKVNLAPGKTSTFKYVVSDISGNSSALEFEMTGNEVMEKEEVNEDLCAQTFYSDRDNAYQSKDLIVYVPKGRLYDATCFPIFIDEGNSKKTYHIGSSSIPIQNDMVIKLKVDSLMLKHSDQLLIAISGSSQNSYTNQGGEFIADWMELRTNKCGTYVILRDSLPPYLRDLTSKGKTKKQLRFSVGDDLSGLKSYNIYVDDQWVLGEYLTQSNILVYNFDPKRLERGGHTFRVELKDAVGNSNSLSGEFTW